MNVTVVTNQLINAKVTIDQGKIRVNPPLTLPLQTKNIVNLEDLSNINITQPAQDGDLFQYDGDTNTWINSPDIDCGTY